MLAITISENTADCKNLENFQTINDRQKRYSLEQKAEFIDYMCQRCREENKPNLTSYAERQGVSRTLLYALYNEFVAAFAPLKSGPKEEKTEAKVENATKEKNETVLVIDQIRVIKSILQAVVSPMSVGDIKRQLKINFDLTMSKRKIKKIIIDYSNKASELLKKLNVEELIKNMAIDEIFCGKDVILTGVDLISMALVIHKAASSRDHKIWQETLSAFSNLETVSSDRASGIIKALKPISSINHQFDLFHFKRDVHKKLRYLEGQAYKKIDLEYRAQAKLCKANRLEYISEYEKHKQEAMQAIHRFDQAEKAIEIIDNALDIFDDEGNFCNVTKNLNSLRHGADLLEKVSSDKKIQNLVAQIRDPRLGLYLKKLQDRILNIDIRYKPGTQSMPRQKILGTIASAWYWKQQKSAPVSSCIVGKQNRRAVREQKEKELLLKQMAVNFQLLQIQTALANFDEVSQQVTFALNNVFRSSSMVEAINSHLRLYQQVKKNLSKNFLSLIALYWNMHPFSDGKRKNKSPFQILGIQGANDNWLDFLLSA